MVETKEGSIAIVDKKELLSGEDKVKLINNYFETGDIKVPAKNIGFYVSRDSDFNFIDRDYRIRTYYRAACTSDTSVRGQFREPVALSVYGFGQTDAMVRAVPDADRTALASLSVNFDCPFKCHFNPVYVHYCAKFTKNADKLNGISPKLPGRAM